MTNKKSAEFEKEFTELFSKVFKGMGLDTLTTKLASILYLEPQEISMDDLAEKTGYSLSAVSAKLKGLENFGMVDRIKKPGTKKIYYYMHKNLKKNNVNKLKAAIELTTTINTQIPPVLKKYELDAKKGSDDLLKKRYMIVEQYLEELNSMGEFFKKMLKELEEL